MGRPFNPLRLRGRQRERVMRHYLAGRITARDAAAAIGVHMRTILRGSPPDFDWDAAHQRYVDRLVARICSVSDIDKIGD